MLAARPNRQEIADPVRILLIEGEPGCAERVGGMLARIPWAQARLDAAADLRQALARLKLEKFNLVIADESAALRELVLASGAYDLVPKEGLDQEALEYFLQLAKPGGESAHAVGSLRAFRRSDASFRKTFALARCQEALARFGQAALLLREPKALIDEAVRSVAHAVSAREVSYIEAANRSKASAGLGDVLHTGVHFVCDGTAIVPVCRSGEVRGALSVQGAGVGAQGADAGSEILPFLHALASLLSTALQRVDSETKLSFRAQFDPLTGLANRPHLIERLSQLAEQAKRRGLPLAVLFVGLDPFERADHGLRHAGGDELLKETALQIQGAVRIDAMVARLDGDAFAVVLPELAKAEDAASAAQKLLERLSQPFLVRGKNSALGASIGIAVCPGDAEGAGALLDAAEAAMHRAKQSGRNGYQFFASEVTRGSRAGANLTLELRRALERDEFRLVYQPKIDLRSGRACGAEALLRWQHPERGVMLPSQFVPLLEETGLIVPVGEWVIARACADLKAWDRPLPVAVNLSARQFRLQGLDRRIVALVQAASVDPALIELEVTESQLMEDPDRAVRVMNALRHGGIRAAIDDFGTGYSSLAWLTRLPLAALKIDRSFVADALTDRADAAIVRAIIDMAHTLDFTVVAEGVETVGQMAFLRQFGCEQGQGFFFARPMSAEELGAQI
jgi:diguanylate cyclase (GGDEF)-like protein